MRLSIRNNSTGSVVSLADINEDGTVTVDNTIESPLVARLVEFLYAAGPDMEILADGKSHFVSRKAITGLISEIRKVNLIVGDN